MTRLRNENITNGVGLLLLALITLVLFLFSLSLGQLHISFSQITGVLFGTNHDEITRAVVLQSRIPLNITALIAGASLSVAGLILQTVFRNPLAGPSLLGVSSGASLGVAILIMGTGATGLFTGLSTGIWWIKILGAILGSLLVIGVLISFSSVIRNGVMLLILGVMISYLCTSVISLLSYLTTAENLRGFTFWGLGSFAGVPLSRLPLFVILCLSLCIISLGTIKPLNAFLLGERYAASLGYNIKAIRTFLLLLSGLLTSIVTAYCGPIGFIGLIVPHIVRICFNTSNHSVVLPASILAGGAVGILCVILSNCIVSERVLPVNVVTPLIGVPIIVYIMLRRNKLPYFK